MKKLFTSLTLVAGLLLLATAPLHAYEEDLIATNGGFVLSGSTNLLNGKIFTGETSDISYQPTCLFTNATTNTFVFDASVNGSIWVSRVMTMTVSQTTATTNTVSGTITNLPAAFRYPFWRVWCENPSSYTSVPKLLGQLKKGI